ncbi:hypothetical protein DH2020_014115 [Rehmannia glutinosa]|uniref:Clp R domain-containing protein n=1 Tax=Rehmannia glutinosa TaxID=99300 RepID=A0ABR0WZ28_REHGL
MRAGLSTIQQTLTRGRHRSEPVDSGGEPPQPRPNDASSRGGDASGLAVGLPEAGMHPNAVAPGMEPPISNALMAALKRAQAHQRRGCPEQQQQPLLAVKVELDQLIISILDDPSVSRVMREAGFSSPAVKATIEQSSTSSTSHGHHHHHHHLMLCNPGQHPLTNRNAYLNPRLQQGITGKMGNNQRIDEITKLLEIMLRSKKKNPILVGDLEPEAIVKEFLKKLENKELGINGVLNNVQVISMEKGLLSDTNQVRAKIKELGDVIESRIGIGGVILDLGDLKWIVKQQHQQQGISRTGGWPNSKWPNYWQDLMRIIISAYGFKITDARMFPRLGTERFFSNSLEPLNPLNAVQTPLSSLTRRVCGNVDPAQRTTFCPQCSENYEKELEKLAAIEKSFNEAQPSLPQWLQNAKLNTTDAKIADRSQEKNQGVISKQKIQELQKKWRDTCLHLHPNFHQTSRADRISPPTLSMTSLYDTNLLGRPIFQPTLLTAKPVGEILQLNPNKVTNSPPASPVRTDLVLGRKRTESTPEKFTHDDQAKEFLGCISSEPKTKLLDKFANALDADTYKNSLKGSWRKHGGRPQPLRWPQPLRVAD